MRFDAGVSGQLRRTANCRDPDGGCGDHVGATEHLRPELRTQFRRWENDVRSILADMQHREDAAAVAAPAVQ